MFGWFGDTKVQHRAALPSPPTPLPRNTGERGEKVLHGGVPLGASGQMVFRQKRPPPAFPLLAFVDAAAGLVGIWATGRLGRLLLELVGQHILGCD